MIARTLKATLFGVASFFVLAPTLTRASSPKKNLETYPETIQKARNLILQKNRPQALDVLVAALKNEKSNSIGFRELKKNIQEISRIFFTEKAQQVYEFSLSLKRADLAQALTKINEALRLEPENFTLLLEAARQNLIKSDCKTALELAQKTQIINPWDNELNLILAQAKMCQNDLPGYASIKEGAVISGSIPWLSLEIERYLLEKNFTKATDALAQLKKIDKNYPEQYYWAWKIDIDQKINNLDSAQEYKSNCQNLTVTFYRRFLLDPRLCGRMVEVENFIKNQPANP